MRKYKFVKQVEIEWELEIPRFLESNEKKCIIDFLMHNGCEKVTAVQHGCLWEITAADNCQLYVKGNLITITKYKNTFTICSL